MVHPHACGELIYIMVQTYLDLGSSPRMWGTLSRTCLTGNNPWFIPTHVGNSSLFFMKPM